MVSLYGFGQSLLDFFYDLWERLFPKVEKEKAKKKGWNRLALVEEMRRRAMYAHDHGRHKIQVSADEYVRLLELDETIVLIPGGQGLADYSPKYIYGCEIELKDER